MALAHAGRAQGLSPATSLRGPSGIKRGGACSGHRLGRVPPGDTLSGFCASLRPLPTCGGQPLRELRWSRTDEQAPTCDGLATLSSGLVFGAELVPQLLVREGRPERLIEEKHLLDRNHVAHEEPARSHAGKPDD